ncbi:hypothetical protein GQ42DRAFT_160464 [Ramicandelaber brevisporus]|nr:hypothetical protein GQ42DRAFT_160464 [Ramicandelaber brevisporus]
MASGASFATLVSANCTTDRDKCTREAEIPLSTCEQLCKVGGRKGKELADCFQACQDNHYVPKIQACWKTYTDCCKGTTECNHCEYCRKMRDDCYKYADDMNKRCDDACEQQGGSQSVINLCQGSQGCLKYYSQDTEKCWGSYTMCLQGTNC